MSVENRHFSGFLLTQILSNLLHVERSTALLHDFPHHLSPLYIAKQLHETIPVIYRENGMFLDPTTRQTFEYSNKNSCKNNPQNVIAIALEPDIHWLNDLFYSNIFLVLKPAFFKYKKQNMTICLLCSLTQVWRFWNSSQKTRPLLTIIQLFIVLQIPYQLLLIIINPQNQ